MIECLRDIYKLIKNNKMLFGMTVIVSVLSYGFFATTYTFHIDQLVPEYYSGNLLITAGRYVAPLIHRVSNWFEFSPFWSTAMMCILFIISGLLTCVLIMRETENNVSSVSLFLYIAIFESSPIMSKQLTYPNLNIALSYCLVPLALLILKPFEKNKSISRYIIAMLLMMAAIDMYESFAPVMLTLLFGIALLKSLYSKNRDGSFKDTVLIPGIKVACVLAVSIVLDFVVSKLICKSVSGSFDFWYEENQNIVWIESEAGIVRCIKRIIVDLLSDIVIGSSLELEKFFFFTAVLSLTVIALEKVIKKQNGLVVCLISIFFIISSRSLALVCGRLETTRQMQAIPVFCGLVALIVFEEIIRKKSKALLTVSAMLFLLVLSVQTQYINNYSVKNYERFDYEISLLKQVAVDLKEYDIKNKPVRFVCDKEYKLPDSLLKREQHPLESCYKKVVMTVWNRVVPEKYGTYELWQKDHKGESVINASYIKWICSIKRVNFISTVLGKLGCDIKSINGAESIRMDNDLVSAEDYNIFEKDNEIYVYFIEN